MFGGAGIVGVTIFFTLSGFLITGVLARDIHRRESVAFGKFYAHRGLRLFPAIVALFVIWAAVSFTWNPENESFGEIGRSLLIGATYTANLPLGMSPTLGHIWSLATEEQFYFVWPALLLVGLRWLKPVSLCLMVAAGLTALCWASLVVSTNPSSIYALPTTWGSCLALGGAGYFLRERLSGRWTAVAGAVGFVVLLALTFVSDAKSSAFTYLVWPTLIAVCTMAVIYLFARWDVLPARILAPGLWLGTVSYGAYLWNLPINVWVNAALNDNPDWVWLTLPLTVLAATISWWTVERWGRVARVHYDARSKLSVQHQGDQKVEGTRPAIRNIS